MLTNLLINFKTVHSETIYEYIEGKNRISMALLSRNFTKKNLSLSFQESNKYSTF